MKRYTILSAALLFSASIAAYSQSHISTQSHQDAVTAVITNTSSSVYTAGNDGFLIKWTEDGLGEHYQVSDLNIRMAACSPDGTEIAVYETDGGTINRLSVWDWKSLTRKYALRFENPVTSLSYSEKGSYILAGTASVSGLIFIDAATGKIQDILKDPTGVISMAATSATENSAVMYSPSGSLLYFNLRTGRQQARFDTVPGLTQTMLFNNNLFFAGSDGKNIYIIQATTGKTVSKIPVLSPVIVSSKQDTNLYYLTSNAKTVALTVIQCDSNTITAPAKPSAVFPWQDKHDQILFAAKADKTIILGSAKGTVNKITLSEQPADDKLVPLTETIYDRIIDISQADNDFYFLTASQVYKSSYDSGTVKHITDNPGQKNIAAYNGSIILWSKNVRKPVQLFDTGTGTLTTLFTPETGIKSLRIFGSKIVYLEGNSAVFSFSIDKMKSEELYTGTGLQDMVLYNDTELYIAKSAATRPESALILINTITKETVPMSLAGTVAYSLNYDSSIDSSTIYGISVSDDQDKGYTSLFAFIPGTKASSQILKINGEDSDAFTSLYTNMIYTNIGKSQIYSCNLLNHNSFAYNRSASLPIKTARNTTKLVVLNKDGSISWYNPDSSSILADWYLTTDGQWFEF